MTGITAEARRLAVTALVEMSKASTEIKAAMDGDPAIMAALRAFGEGAVGAGGSGGSSAGDVEKGDGSCASYEGDRLQQSALLLIRSFHEADPAPDAKRQKR